MKSDLCRFSDELLHYLQRKKHAEAKKCLIGMDRPSRLVDARGATLLHCAAERGNPHMMRYFLDSGFDIDQQDHEGQTPLMYALRTWNSVTVELLVRRGADIYARARNDGDWTLLQEGLSSHVDGIVKAFVYRLRREHPTNERLARVLHDPLYTLHPVVYLRNAELTRLLLEKGHCPARTFQAGITSLDLAIQLSDLDNVKLLLDYGMNVNALAPTRPLPVDSIPRRDKPRKLEVLKLLIDYGADLNLRCPGDELTEAPYHVMFQYGTREMVRLLLETDRDFAVKNIRTLLLRLTRNGHEGAMQEIKGIECDPNARGDKQGRAVLDLAVEHGHISAIEFLLSEGADVDFAAKFGNKTALARVLICKLSPKSKMERLKILLEHGADPQRAYDRYAGQSTTPLEEVVARKDLHALAKALLAYVILRERILGQAVSPKTRSIVEADRRFERYFQLCIKHIEIMETTRIRASVTMLDLLAKDVEWIANRVRNSDLDSELTRMCRKLCLNKYYSAKLQRRAKEIVNVVNARREAAKICNDIFGHLYHKNHLITDKMISFINYHYLKKTLQANNESG